MQPNRAHISDQQLQVITRQRAVKRSQRVNPPSLLSRALALLRRTVQA